MTGVGSGATDKMYKINRDFINREIAGGDVFGFFLNPSDQSFIYVPANILRNNANEIDVGSDGIIALIDGNGVFKNTGVDSSFWISLGSGGGSGAVQVSIGNSNQLYALLSDGQVVKWVSGSSWYPVDIFPAAGARFVACGDDGTLWFIDGFGNLKVKHPITGVVSDVAGGQGLDLVKVKAAGTFDDYVLVALTRQGRLYSAHTQRRLEYEGFGHVTDVGIGKSGLCAVIFAIDSTDSEQVTWGGRTYVGWIKDKVPAGWPYPR